MLEQFHMLAILLGGLIVLLSFLEKRIQLGPVSEPLLAMIAGIAVGPLAIGLVKTAQWGEELQILHLIVEATLAMALMATALRLPTDYLQKYWKSLLVLLGVVLPLMVLFSALSFWSLLSIPFLTALLLGAIVAPTDPVIAAAIVSGPVARKYLPSHTRHTISMESGSNDGLGMPFVLLPILLISNSSGGAWSEWFFKVLLWENIGGIVIGAAVGLGTGKLIRKLNDKKELTSKAFLSFSVAIGFLVLAGMELIKANGVVAVFATGLGINHVMHDDNELKAERVQDMIERFFTVPVFFIFGLLLPWKEWSSLGWAAVAVPLLILLARRLPAIFLAQKGVTTLKRTADLWFAGWFGPIGVAAMYYAVLAEKQLKDSTFWVWPSLIIFCSTIIHGITSGPFVKWYKKKVPHQKD